METLGKNPFFTILAKILVSPARLLLLPRYSCNYQFLQLPSPPIFTIIIIIVIIITIISFGWAWGRQGASIYGKV